MISPVIHFLQVSTEIQIILPVCLYCGNLKSVISRNITDLHIDYESFTGTLNSCSDQVHA